MAIDKNTLVILFILILIPLICIAIFLMPAGIQDSLRMKTSNTDVLTIITSTFVHADSSHLMSNVVAFEIFGFLLLIINKSALNTKFLVYSILIVVLLMPIVYNISFVLLDNSLFLSNSSSCGLSTVVGGFIGLVVPSLILFFKEELKSPSSVLLFFMGLFFVTSSMVIQSYLSSMLSVIFFLLLLPSGLILFLYSLRNGIRYGKQLNGKREAKKVVIISVAMLLYFIFLSALFPTNLVIVQEGEKGIVNIFAHYFGVFLGLSLPSAYLYLKHRNYFSNSSFKRGTK